MSRPHPIEYQSTITEITVDFIGRQFGLSVQILHQSRGSVFDQQMRKSVNPKRTREAILNFENGSLPGPMSFHMTWDLANG